MSPSPEPKQGREREWQELENFAREGWEWLVVALDAGGWKTVFDIPDFQERSRRLKEAGAFDEVCPPTHRAERLDTRYGAWQRPDGSLFRAVPLDATEGPKFNRRADQVIRHSCERAPDRYLTPAEAEAAIDRAERLGLVG